MRKNNISSSDIIDSSDIIKEIESSNRKLASVQRIVSITEIPKADRIELATVLGWQCVTKKGEFKVGDLVVYIEVDSKVPAREEFEFLRDRKFRVRTIKLRKQISEGLIVPLTILPENESCKEGDDVTQILGVIKHDPEGKAERALIAKQKRGPIMRFAMGIPAFRKVYLKLNEKKGPWPHWIARTDETRIQVCAKHIMEHYDEEWEITEKLDGQSATFFIHPMKVWGFTRTQFGVCSRKIWLKTPNGNKYWQTANKFGVEHALRKVKLDDGSPCNNIYIQGEQCGPSIQGNKYKLIGLEIFVFNTVINGVKQAYNGIAQFCDKSSGIKAVPLVNGSFIPKRDIGENKTVMEVVQFLVDLSQGNSSILPRQREGIVMRLKSNPDISLKVINPLFKMEQEKEEDSE